MLKSAEIPLPFLVASLPAKGRFALFLLLYPSTSLTRVEELMSADTPDTEQQQGDIPRGGRRTTLRASSCLQHRRSSFLVPRVENVPALIASLEQNCIGPVQAKRQKLGPKE